MAALVRFLKSAVWTRIWVAALLFLLGTCFAGAATAPDPDAEQFRQICGGARVYCTDVSAPWALVVWVSKKRYGIKLLQKINDRWTPRADRTRWTRDDLVQYGLREQDMNALGYGLVAEGLLNGLAAVATTQRPHATTFHVATMGSAIYALTNRGNPYNSLQVVWTLTRGRWRPLFAYDGLKTDRARREKLFAKNGLSLYLEMLLSDGATARRFDFMMSPPDLPPASPNEKI